MRKNAWLTIVFFMLLLLSFGACYGINSREYVVKESEINKQSSTQDAEKSAYYNWRDAKTLTEHDNIQGYFTDQWMERGYDRLICGYDSSDLVCLLSNNPLKKEAIIDWEDDWIPRSYPLEECRKLLQPQLWEEPIALQDVCALYLIDSYDCKDIVPHMSIESFLRFATDNHRPPTDVFFQNMELLSQLADAQSGRIVQVDGSIKTDLDCDGIDETIELTISDNADNNLDTYQLYVNGKQVEVFYNTELLVELIDLQSCKVICVKPKGKSDRSDLDRSTRDALFGFFDGETRFLGTINGSFSVFIGNGRFLTTETMPFDHPDLLFAEIVVESLTHEYGVTSDGLLYHVFHGREDFLESPFGWQQQNTLWELREDIPLYKKDGITLSGDVLKKGDRIIIRGISENGYLYLCDEKGTGGVIRLIRPELEPQDPFAAPGGRRLSYYFRGYDCFAYADGWEE